MTLKEIWKQICDSQPVCEFQFSNLNLEDYRIFLRNFEFNRGWLYVDKHIQVNEGDVFHIWKDNFQAFVWTYNELKWLEITKPEDKYPIMQQALISRSVLPGWMLPVISYIAYEQSHSGGIEEVYNKFCSMLCDFEEAYKKCPFP